MIEIVNDDSAEPFITSRPETAFDIHVTGGQTTIFTAPVTPGEYRFYCVYYPRLADILIVR